MTTVFTAMSVRTALLAAVLPLLLAGCGSGVAPGSSQSSLGLRCEVPPAAISPASTALSSPALECLSRLCLVVSGSASEVRRSTCTEHCVLDEDCAGGVIPNANDPNSTGLCTSRFLCRPVGPGQSAAGGKAQSVCVCADDVLPASHG